MAATLVPSQRSNPTSASVVGVYLTKLCQWLALAFANVAGEKGPQF